MGGTAMQTSQLLGRGLTGVLAVLVMAGPAAAQFRDLVSHVPNGANALVILNVEKILSSPLGEREGWKSNLEKAFSAGMVRVPPKAKRFIMAAQIDFEFMKPNWEAAVADLERAPSMGKIAKEYEATPDKFGDTEALLLPSDAYVMALREKTLAAMAPANRQVVARWLQELESPSKLSAYLQKAAGYSEEAGTEIIVAVDVSGSMADAMPQLKAATKKFLSALRPADRVTLIGFNDNVFTLARPGVDLAARLRAVDRLAPWGGTALYDVIVQAVDQLGRHAGRRVLVVFTDGEDLNSHVAVEVAEGRLEASDVVLYPIGQGRAVEGAKSLKAILERLAQKTGGRAFFEEADRLEAVFGNILEELSNQYLLGYVPRNPRRDGAWRTVRVELAQKGLRVRARQGYRLMPR